MSQNRKWNAVFFLLILLFISGCVHRLHQYPLLSSSRLDIQKVIEILEKAQKEPKKKATYFLELQQMGEKGPRLLSQVVHATDDWNKNQEAFPSYKKYWTWRQMMNPFENRLIFNYSLRTQAAEFLGMFKKSSLSIVEALLRIKESWPFRGSCKQVSKKNMASCKASEILIKNSNKMMNYILLMLEHPNKHVKHGAIKVLGEVPLKNKAYISSKLHQAIKRTNNWNTKMKAVEALFAIGRNKYNSIPELVRLYQDKRSVQKFREYQSRVYILLALVKLRANYQTIYSIVKPVFGGKSSALECQALISLAKSNHPKIIEIIKIGIQKMDRNCSLEALQNLPKASKKAAELLMTTWNQYPKGVPNTMRPYILGTLCMSAPKLKRVKIFLWNIILDEGILRNDKIFAIWTLGAIFPKEIKKSIPILLKLFSQRPLSRDHQYIIKLLYFMSIANKYIKKRPKINYNFDSNKYSLTWLKGLNKHIKNKIKTSVRWFKKPKCFSMHQPQFRIDLIGKEALLKRTPRSYQ